MSEDFFISEAAGAVRFLCAAGGRKGLPYGCVGMPALATYSSLMAMAQLPCVVLLLPSMVQLSSVTLEPAWIQSI